MNRYLKLIYDFSPTFIQNTMVSVYDLKYIKRHGGEYKKLKAYYKKAQFLPIKQLKALQFKKLKIFLKFVENNSNYYKGTNFDKIKSIDDLSNLPIMEKEELRNNIKNISTIERRKSYVSQTGGTTGKSLEVFFRWDDIQDRFAMLDAYREKFNYKFGDKTAWFSGKKILNKRDERKNKFWKYDYFYKIRYYSTFHINDKSIPYIIEDLNSFHPKIISGFPSNIFDIANSAIINNIKINFKPQVIFTTAETLLPHQKKLIESVFKCNVYDRYGSSEGATYLFQCSNGKYHYQLLSGIIEIVDKDMKPALNGEILITSFVTRGTPLIRYRIGDSMRISSEKCECGDNQPIIASLDGRAIDFIYSKERGKINLGNISNCVKDIRGIKKFQIIQDKIDEIDVFIVPDNNLYNNKEELLFKKELIDRLGDTISINISYVKNIKKSRSGKFNIVINKINHLCL